MRPLILAVSVFALAACGEPAPASNASVAPVAASGTDVADANFLTPDQIAGKLVGGWVSTQDDKAELTITSDGKWVETYQLAEPETATWRIFPGDQPPPGATETFTPASRYIEVKREDGVYYYELGHVADDGFDMFYTARGNHLSFTRVKSPA